MFSLTGDIIFEKYLVSTYFSYKRDFLKYKIIDIIIL